MSGLDDLRDSLLLPTEPFGDGYDEIHNMRQESNHERNVQTLLVIDRLREALLLELDRLEAVTAKQVEEYPTDPKVWTAYRDALSTVRRWAGDDHA